MENAQMTPSDLITTALETWSADRFGRYAKIAHGPQGWHCTLDSEGKPEPLAEVAKLAAMHLVARARVVAADDPAKAFEWIEQWLRGAQ